MVWVDVWMDGWRGEDDLTYGVVLFCFTLRVGEEGWRRIAESAVTLVELVVWRMCNVSSQVDLSGVLVATGSLPYMYHE